MVLLRLLTNTARIAPSPSSTRGGDDVRICTRTRRGGRGRSRDQQEYGPSREPVKTRWRDTEDDGSGAQRVPSSTDHLEGDASCDVADVGARARPGCGFRGPTSRRGHLIGRRVGARTRLRGQLTTYKDV